MRVPILKAGLVAAIAAAIAVSVTGCSILQDALIPRSEDASLNIQDTPVTISGNHVSTACFDFTTPDIGQEWEIHPDASECVADVRWPDSNLLTTIRVRVQTGKVSYDSAERSLRKAGYEDITGSEITIDGRPAYAFKLVDAMGLSQDIIIVTLPDGRFTLDGTPLTSIFVGGYSLMDAETNYVNAIAHSIEIH